MLAGRGEEILLERHYGSKSLFPMDEPLEAGAVYDLASLTKPLITALLTVYLTEKEKGLSLQTEVREFFPFFPHHVKLIHLLTHTAGLPGWHPFYLFGPDYLEQFRELPLRSRPGKKVVYSCAGYILLYYIIEKITGVSFRQSAREVIFEPLGLKRTFFSVPEALIAQTAPTEWGELNERKLAEKAYPEEAARFDWRKKVFRGEVHDSNSFYLGGTAGNAGLFSTAADIFKLSREFYPGTATILSPEATAVFWKNYTPLKLGHRTVGFKRNSSFIRSGGGAFSRKAIGHNGFTGTSLWLNPDGLVMVLLTNRIHPIVTPEVKVRFNHLRRKLHKILL